MLEPWDSPNRTRRLDADTKQPISDAEWEEWEWFNVTAMTDPPDAHMYIRTFKRSNARTTAEHHAPADRS
jgi:hypothetical protein